MSSNNDLALNVVVFTKRSAKAPIAFAE